MAGVADKAKFAELRAKTDQELLVLICHGLDRAFRRYAEGLPAEAQTAYQQADVLLSKIYTIPPGEWLRLETRLAHLDKLLRLASIQHPDRASEPAASRHAAFAMTGC